MQTGPGSVAFVGAKLREPEPDPTTPRPALGTALLIEDGIITKTGTDAEICAAAEAHGIPVHNVSGATITPGLFDSHTHPLWAVNVTVGVDLAGVDTLEKLREVLAAEHTKLPAGAWLRGWNLEYEPFEETGITYTEFAAAAPGRPIALMFYDLHTAVGNAEALALAGITGPREFADTSEIVVSASGTPTGELREPSAYNLLFAAAPPLSHEEERDALRDMFRTLAAVGLTGGAIMDGSPHTVELLRELEERGELDHRVVVHHWHRVEDTDEDVARVIAAAGQRGRLWECGAIKLFSDGVIDTGTAWLHEVDSQGDGREPFWQDWRRFDDVVHAYHAAGLTIATHAVGDYAVNRVLDVYESLHPRAGLPGHSIEHLEVLSDVEVARIREFGERTGKQLIASMQPLHMQWRSPDHTDNWARRLGVRASTGYRVRDVLEAGGRLVLGSDWPVATFDPRIGMSWARGRQAPGSVAAHTFEPGQRLSGPEALAAYTAWPAAAREWDNRGTLRVGAVGDITVWDQDPAHVSPDWLPKLEVLFTVVEGRVVFRKELV